MDAARVGGRRPSATGRLIRLGFADAARASTLLADPDLALLLDSGPGSARRPVGSDPGAADALVEALARSADPDLALLQVVRWAAALVEDRQARAKARAILGVEPGAEATPETGPRDRLIAVFGASSALGDEVIRRPELLDVLADPTCGIEVDPQIVRTELLTAVGADPQAAMPVATGATSTELTDALRRAYRTRLLRIAATDLTRLDPLSQLPAVAAALADLAGAALDGALAVARADLPDHGAGVRLAVIGMGKCGARELNYVSDVDVIYVAEPASGVEDSAVDVVRVGSRLATALARVCSAPSAEPALWAVDAGLRPEGAQGPLVRSLASHIAYYERWASTWEFQALLKARTVAGDRELGAAYESAIAPFIWSAAGREHFVEDAQAMRRRVEDHVPPAQADRQLKLGKGGLRDVEFTVQLLQLVHGRSDESLRERGTLTALADLAASGYVGREAAARLAVCYRFLRSLEHRIQLFHLRRTHLVPTGEEDLRRLARSLGMRAEGADGLEERWRATRREVRDLHEALFYRPLLPATAQLSSAEVALAPEAARARFAAIGYRDPAGAMRHVNALTEGVSRRAAIQRQLLPVMLGWFAEGADPDGGLLAFRTVSEKLGRTHWYLKLLRDSGSAARRLARLLAGSRYVADAIARSPESITWLDDDADLAPRGIDRLRTEAEAIASRAPDPESAAVSLRALRRRELARTAAAELLGEIGTAQAQRAISDAADVSLAGVLRVAEALTAADRGLPGGQEPPTRMLVVAMGRLGGREMGYGSDADVLFVHDPVPQAEPAQAQAYALAVAARLRQLLSALGPEPALAVDADLRPEGRQGALVRSLDSYAEYYGRWSGVWEAQALLRARTVAGPDDLARRFTALIDPVRYPAALEDGQIREIRRIKARVEAERLPRGADPARHLKLGRGGVADVEWTVQLLQLRHAHEVRPLRTTSTVEALEAAEGAGLLLASDGAALRDAWYLASALRSALVLWTGRTGGPDALPHDRRDLAGVARVLDPSGATSGQEIEEHYLRVARRARAVMDRVFYG